MINFGGATQQGWCDALLLAIGPQLRFLVAMTRGPGKWAKPPRRKVDWTMTIIIGLIVVVSALLAGLLLSDLTYR